MKPLIEFIAKSLVDNADDVQVYSSERDQATVFELEVSEDDLGKIIGRQGRTARAIRTLLSAAGQKQRRRFILDILD